MIQISIETVPQINDRLMNEWQNCADGNFAAWLRMNYDVIFKESRRSFSYCFHTEEEYHQFLLNFG